MSARTKNAAAAALLCAFLLTLILSSVRPSAGQEPAPVGDLTPDQVAVEPGPLQIGELSPQSGQPEYLSPPTEAARPFSHLLVRRVAAVPPGASLALFVRASVNGSDWTRWEELVSNEDLYVAADGPEVQWSQVVDVGGTARFWQVRAAFTAAPDGALPELKRFEVNTVDASAGPASPQPDIAPQSVGRPPVVSRRGWGLAEHEDRRRPPDYHPVTHIIVHHTAEANPLNPGSVDWPARVRAIWSFHANSRGWGDIGYNYLIDPNGVIYEGRFGGDNAVGFHDTANYGSMGVSMMGTFTSVQPSPATLDSLVKLMAWKANQRDIDPLGRSFYYGCTTSRLCRDRVPGSIVPNIAGHRQVTPGHTACPGDATMALMPELRNRVKQLIESGGAGGGGIGDNGDLQIDELEPTFARSNATWYSAECGAGGHTFYTFGTNLQSQSTNSATWRPNIPERARYRVFAHIPRGCGPGQATSNAVYRIASADGPFERRVDQSASDGWVDLGAYTFNAGTGGAVELYDLTGDPLSARRVLFFDAVRWVREDTQANLALADVRYDRTTLTAGELLKVTFTVENRGQATVFGQGPRSDAGRPQEAYVYDEAECFAGRADGTVPSFAKETDRVRVTLGVAGWDGANAGRCAGGTSDNPWRWGLGDPLPPGTRQEVVGYVRFRTPGVYTLRAGVIQEYVRYHVEQFAPTTITVTPERDAPDAAAYDGQLRPQAQVYRLADVPDSLLARALPAPTAPRGEYVGSIPFDGTFTDWGAGGPLGLSDRFVVEQARAFLAPVSGDYTFRTTTDDGSWLLVNGRPVVGNGGLHQLQDAEGTVRLAAGVHTLSFIYFERSGEAAAGYDVRLPGASAFTPVLDGAGGGAMLLGGTFAEEPDLAIGADDRGGSGVASVRWRWAGGEWRESPGALLRVNDVTSGTHQLEYQAVDLAGNLGPPRQIALRVDTSLTPSRVYLPMTGR